LVFYAHACVHSVSKIRSTASAKTHLLFSEWHPVPGCQPLNKLDIAIAPLRVRRKLCGGSFEQTVDALQNDVVDKLLLFSSSGHFLGTPCKALIYVLLK
jgi:hypothetical protein